MEAVCYAFLSADKVITEDNGKRGVIGIFSAFNFPQFPAVAPPWFIYVQLANVMKRHEFTINLVRDQAAEVVMGISGEINAAAQGDEADIIIPVFNLNFQKPGRYTLTLNFDGQPLASRVLKVNVAQTPGLKN